MPDVTGIRSHFGSSIERRDVFMRTPDTGLSIEPRAVPRIWYGAKSQGDYTGTS